MKKVSKAFIVSLALSLTLGGGLVAALHQNKVSETKANIINNTGYVFSNDSTCSNTLYYQRSGSDLTTLNWSSMSSTSTGGFTIPGPTQSSYTLTEAESNKNYNYCYRPFFFYPFDVDQIGMAPYSRYTINVTFTLLLNKVATGGGAYAFAELFFLGNSNATTNQPTPVLTDNRFDTNQSRSGTSDDYHNAYPTSNSIGCYTDKASQSIYASVTKILTFENPASNYGVSRYQLGLFLGCNYGSSYAHQASASVSANINSVTKESIVAQVNGNNYTTFGTAYNATVNGDTISLLKDCTLGQDNGLAINRNITINLNGHTLSAYSRSSYLQIATSRTVTINGAGGSLYKDFNYSDSSQLLSLQTNANLTLNNVTVRKLSGANPTIIMSSGSTLSANSSTYIYSDSSYTNAYAINAMGTLNLNGSYVQSSSASAIYMSSSGTLTATGGTIKSTSSYAIETTSGGNRTIILSGAVTLGSGTGLGHIGLYANSGIVNASGLTKAVTINVIGGYFTTNVALVTNDTNNKVTVNSTTPSGYSYVRVDGDIFYRLNQYTLTFNPNGGTGAAKVFYVNHGSSYSMPGMLNVEFSAPSYHSLKRWNTAQNDSGTAYVPGSSYVITSNLTLYAIWYQTDTNIVEQFVGIDLHFDVDVIDPSNVSDTGACRGENGYYALAKATYNSFSNAQKAIFCENANFANARERFIAWAHANGEDLNLTTYNIVQLSARNIGDQVRNNATVIIIVSIISIVSSTAIALVLLKRKRLQ